jgi:hypothetical protein
MLGGIYLLTDKESKELKNIDTKGQKTKRILYCFERKEQSKREIVDTGHETKEVYPGM